MHTWTGNSADACSQHVLLTLRPRQLILQAKDWQWQATGSRYACHLQQRPRFLLPLVKVRISRCRLLPSCKHRCTHFYWV